MQQAAAPMREMVEFQWERTKFFDTDAVLNILPTPLRLNVLLDMNKTFMFTVPFFQDQDEAIIKEIVQVLGHELVLAGTLVVHEGQPADKMFFTRFGNFEVLAPHSYVVVQHLGIGDYFGEIGLLVNHGRYSATVRASPNTRCELATLSREDLERLINTFPVFAHSFKSVGLDRLRSTRNNFLRSRFAGQTEYRIVLEVIKGYNIVDDDDQSVVMGEVVTQTMRKRRGSKNEINTDGEEDFGSKQIGNVHRTERRRGKNPYFGNVFIIEICCHERQRLESIEHVITLYQCHSWRPPTYIGTVKINPVDIRLGQVTKQWYRLKNLETPSECDVIMNACKAEREGSRKKKRKKKMGQILLRMVRHRDSGGRDAQLRASQGIRELAKASRANTQLTAAHVAKLKRQESVLKARALKSNHKGIGASKEEESGLPEGKKSWKVIKKRFLTSHSNRKQEFADGLRFGAQMTMLDQFSTAMKKKRQSQQSSNGGVFLASASSRESIDRSIQQCSKLRLMGEKLRDSLVLIAQKDQ